MARDDQEDRNRAPTPPYIAFQSLRTVAASMKENGIPSRVDRSVLSNFSGAVGSQIMTALKFLNLTDADNHPNDAMKALVHSYGGEDFPGTLARILRSAYKPIFELDLQSASPGQFKELFRKTYPSAEQVQRKQVTFFLNAAREAGIGVSQYIMKNKKPRTALTKRRNSKQNGKPGVAGVDQNAKTDEQQFAIRRPSETLLSLLDIANMGNEEQDAIWRLIKYFKSRDQ